MQHGRRFSFIPGASAFVLILLAAACDNVQKPIAGDAGSRSVPPASTSPQLNPTRPPGADIGSGGIGGIGSGGIGSGGIGSGGIGSGGLSPDPRINPNPQPTVRPSVTPNPAPGAGTVTDAQKAKIQSLLLKLDRIQNLVDDRNDAIEVHFRGRLNDQNVQPRFNSALCDLGAKLAAFTNSADDRTRISQYSSALQQAVNKSYAEFFEILDWNNPKFSTVPAERQGDYGTAQRTMKDEVAAFAAELVTL